jgi:hypothetical protein
MNEDVAVLNFFAKEENLTLGLSVAEQMDEIRIGMNSKFWKALQAHLNTFFMQNSADWKAEAIEDRNATEVLVGLQCNLQTLRPLYLFPMLEQQYLGGVWRIFFGLMWSSAPSATQLTLPAVANLKQTLIDSGFKTNEAFLAWQWTPFYPRRRDFLLRQSQQPDKLVEEVASLLQRVLTEQRELITAANAALCSAPVSVTVSLDQLHRKNS